MASRSRFPVAPVLLWIGFARINSCWTYSASSKPWTNLTLRPGQVDEGQLADPEVLLAVEAPLGALDGDGEDGVAPGAALVHLGGADHAVLVAHRHDLVHVVGVVHHEGGEVLHVHADVRTLLHLEPGASQGSFTWDNELADNLRGLS